MEPIKNFSQLTAHIASRTAKKRIVVVCPRDEHTQEAVRRVEEDGIAEPILVDNDNAEAAAREAVNIVRRGEADILMKGLIGSDMLLRAILNKEEGILAPGSVLTLVACASLPCYDKLLFYTDPAVIPYPTQQQREALVGYIVSSCRAFGISEPRVSLIHCIEKSDPRHFPFTAGYADIIAKARRGDYGKCIVDGPLDVKTSCSSEAMAIKKIHSPIAGEADGLVFPDIEAANVFHKTITMFPDVKVATMLLGTQVPVVVTSRADDVDTKYYSIALAALHGDNQNA